MELSKYIFYHMNEGDKTWWVELPCDKDGEMLFSFDKERVFNFFEDYPDKLTPEQKKVFDKENPIMANLKAT